MKYIKIAKKSIKNIKNQYRMKIKKFNLKKMPKNKIK